MASPQAYRSLIAPLTDLEWSPAETDSHAGADSCLTYLSPTTILVTRPLKLTFLDLTILPLTMDARRPPEYTLEIAADRTNVKDVVKGSNMSARYP